MRIPAVPEHVCNAHAKEFWTGLLAFATNRPYFDEQDNQQQIDELMVGA